MFFKLIILITLLISNISYAEIVYEKNNVSISRLELNEYVNLHGSNYNKSLSENKALKEIVLMKKTISFLLEYNSPFMKVLDENLDSAFPKNFFDTSIKRDFYRFFKIRNEFISEYFNNEFNLDDLKIIFSSTKKLELPISDNRCLTILKIVDLSENNFFLQNLYENLKNNSNNFRVRLNEIDYYVCINTNLFKELESIIIDYIDSKIEKNFNNFIYSKLY